MMKDSRVAQRGIGMLGLLLVVGLLAFVLLVGLRLMPVYLENFKVEDVLESLHQEGQLTQKSTRDIQRLILKRLEINDVHNVSKEHIDIQKKRGQVIVNIQYEVRTSLFGNLDIVARFDELFEAVAH